jgi:hypothetical protein
MDLGIFGMNGKGYRYRTWIVSCVAGATFLISSLLLLLLGQLRLYDSFPAGQSGTFHFGQDLYFISLP